MAVLSIDKPEEMKLTMLTLISWKASIVGQASATVARKVVSIKKYFEYLADIGEIDIDPSAKLKNVKIKNKEKTPLTPASSCCIDCAGKIRTNHHYTTCFYWYAYQ